MTEALSGKVALVTGASRGIGYAIAKALASHGAHIIAIARTQKGLESLDDEIQALGGTATLTPFDLREFDRIDALGGIVAEKWGRLDILVGNAAILGTLGPVGHIEPEEWGHLLDINLSANWRLIRAFDSLLRASDNGRAIFVTSSVASQRLKPYWGGYAAAKAGLETMIRTYALEVAKTPMRINILDPGATRTAMRAQAMPGEDTNALHHPDEIAKTAVDMLLPSWTDNGDMIIHNDYVA